jgi:trimeric autotransporter adhesin
MFDLRRTSLPRAISLAVSLATPATAQCATTCLPGLGTPGVGGGVTVVFGVPLEPETAGHIAASTLWDPDGPGPAAAELVVAGSFRYFGATSASNIARIDLATGTVRAFGSGLRGSFVSALAALPNGNLVAGGYFTTAGGAAIPYLAQWNGSSWQSIGVCDQFVGALLVRPTGELIAAGYFNDIGGSGAARIASWDGVSWSPLGVTSAGSNDAINALAQLPNGDLIAGGSFQQIGGVAASCVARWDGTIWSPLGSGFPMLPQNLPSVRCLAVRQNGNLICGGGYGGLFSAGEVNEWDGTSWLPYAAPIDAIAWSLLPLANGDVVVGTGHIGPSCRVWNGTSWSNLGLGMDYAVRSLLQLPNGHIVAGGDFYQADQKLVNHVALWDGATWSALTDGMLGTAADVVRLPNGDTVAGGSFTRIGGVPVDGLAIRTGSTWAPLTGGVRQATTFTVTSNGALLAAGPTLAGPNHAVVRISGSSSTLLGAPSDGLIGALVELSNGDVLAGGAFTAIGGSAANNLARWNGAAWQAFAGGTNGVVHAIAPMPNGDLVIGGEFTLAGGVPANSIARWNGSNWQALGSGILGAVRALAVRPSGELVAAGIFVDAGGIYANAIARWNGTTWTDFGNAFGNVGLSLATVNALVALPNGDVIAGGYLRLGSIYPHLVRWDGASWSPFDGGANGTVRRLSRTPTGSVLAAGTFTLIGEQVSARIAELATSCPAAAVPFGSGCSGSGGPDVLTPTALPWLGSIYRAMATGLPPLSIGVVVTGLSTLAIPLPAVLPQGLPGCTLLTTPDLLDFVLPQNGTAVTQLAIPNDLALANRMLHQQLMPMEFDLAGNFVALTSSNAVTLTIGAF